MDSQLALNKSNFQKLLRVHEFQFLELEIEIWHEGPHCDAFGDNMLHFPKKSNFHQISQIFMISAQEIAENIDFLEKLTKISKFLESTHYFLQKHPSAVLHTNF